MNMNVNSIEERGGGGIVHNVCTSFCMNEP